MSALNLYAPFRPRRARYVCVGLAVLLIIGLAVLFAVVPTEGNYSFGLDDYIAGVIFVSIFLVLLYLHYQVNARVSETGIRVKNLITSHDLTWEEIVSVEFGSGPWARLDVSDGRTVPVMAIQYADGEFAQREAVRLATLAEHHSEPDHDYA